LRVDQTGYMTAAIEFMSDHIVVGAWKNDSQILVDNSRFGREVVSRSRSSNSQKNIGSRRTNFTRRIFIFLLKKEGVVHLNSGSRRTNSA
jgi:hypothetical protein